MRKEIKKPCLPAGRAGLYDPYLNTLGGGEKYILLILKVLEEQGIEINIFWDQDLSSEIKDRLSLNFNNLKFLPNIFHVDCHPFKKISILKSFDYFFYMTDGSYFFSSAKKNLVYVMVPKKKLLATSLINKIKTLNYSFITHSKFTQNQLKKWGIKSALIYPYIDIKPTFAKASVGKDKIILSVGRFFKHLHSKRQDLAIKYFRKLKDQNNEFKDFKLVLAGGLHKEDDEYYQSIKKLIGNDQSISLLPNISHKELIKLYEKSMFFWHFAGYGIDENKNPELVEHLGLTPLEAMASGCLTFCYNAGGPKEMIRDGENGFLFGSHNELLNKMTQILKDEKKQKYIKVKAREFVEKNFNYKIFKTNVLKIL